MIPLPHYVTHIMKVIVFVLHFGSKPGSLPLWLCCHQARTLAAEAWTAFRKESKIR